MFKREKKNFFYVHKNIKLQASALLFALKSIDVSARDDVPCFHITIHTL